LFAALAPGCSRTRNQGVTGGTVGGKVTYKDAPVTGGDIVFLGKENNKFTVPIAADGTYLVVGLPVGDMVVTISTESLNPKPDDKKFKDPKTQKQSKGVVGADFLKQKLGVANTNAPAAAEKKYVKIPAKYASPQTSPLVYSVVEGKQTKDFVLTD
jgi:hypothetical protein